ncbi:CHASE2 domain-containing sensor protein [Mycobacterium frederiksbergense]|uniref:CHASE2 domain-containing sensor protein n=1 Tax=Mycolicibacterium frederiksbergense TaxID=117567 RepID=A0ABT6L8K1_9MYCO|nr:hypothetical protein [Mycolicibacterium frederiksbergense]MDH6199234.1 CHASE2 domain-containing sensor protein [Mycolicibacterium frederiksbergense]
MTDALLIAAMTFALVSVAGLAAFCIWLLWTAALISAVLFITWGYFVYPDPDDEWLRVRSGELEVAE